MLYTWNKNQDKSIEITETTCILLTGRFLSFTFTHNTNTYTHTHDIHLMPCGCVGNQFNTRFFFCLFLCCATGARARSFTLSNIENLTIFRVIKNSLFFTWMHAFTRHTVMRVHLIPSRWIQLLFCSPQIVQCFFLLFFCFRSISIAICKSSNASMHKHINFQLVSEFLMKYRKKKRMKKKFGSID